MIKTGLRNLILTSLLGAFFATGSVANEKPKLDFNRDIRPILSDNCFQCHGPDANQRKADLRLDTREGIFEEFDGVKPVSPGHSDKSEIYLRMTSHIAKEKMPPAKSNKSLTAEQIATIKTWIEQGAEFKGHWAYIAPEKSTVPKIDGAVNPIDAFIAERLKNTGMSAANEADRVTLCRRVYFDLLGLPPTVQQVDEFVNDKNPNAYEKLVDKLLSSGHFGERMAAYWLDQVRYADTIGYHSDTPMNVSPYRDWVIAAFNQNMPFDQFTIEQLAGDLLPNSTQSQKVASAYNRLLQTTEEGGAQPKEYEAKYAADRVRNVSTVWMAQTMGCCECHDHKFDPISAKEFYSMAAFFADVQEASVGKREPGMPLMNKENEQKQKHLDESLAEARNRLKKMSPEVERIQQEWETTALAELKWETLDPQTFIVQGESKLKKLENGILLTTYKVAANENQVITFQVNQKGITGLRLEALTDDSLPQKGPGNSGNANFVLTDVKVTITGKDGKAKNIALKNATADFSQEGYPVSSLTDAKRKDRKKFGWAILNETGKPHQAVFEIATPPNAPLNLPAGSILTITMENQSIFPQHSIGKFRWSYTTVAEPSKKTLPMEVRNALAVAYDKRTDKQKTAVSNYYQSVSPQLQPVRDEIAELEKQKQVFLNSLPKCLVTSAINEPRVVRVLARGNWLDSTGEIVTPDVPASICKLPPLDTETKAQNAKNKSRPTRLDLAKWIVSRDNPLTARVFANRIWKLYFGQGLSRSVNDLGSQGDWPTHPELLDWLSVTFMDSKWDMKHLVKLIVTSKSYRQSSIPTAQQKERDPANLYLSRQNRYRLDAEYVRDNALSISGLLIDQIGGKTAFPYQPAGYWSFLNFPTREWQNDKGDGLYRRGLYTHWQRTFLQPSLLAFDAPTREESVCERTRSNVPQQALALLNDVTYVEASRKFAEQIYKSSATTAERLNFAYRTALSRSPQESELKLLSSLYEKHLLQYQTDKPAAEKLLSIGDAPSAKDIDPAELAAWTSVSRVILNLHEVITRN